ncbi:hypothetical protein H4O14_16965 [Bacillus sp. PAMC26568]|nr:hypothetical protein H4O14_16965 [Bacillus sp. PAMC26568]
MYKPKWSKLKKELEGFICDSLKDRVSYYATNYRKAHDQLGRAYITVDKKEVFNMCTIKSNRILFNKENELRKLIDIDYDVDNGAENYRISVQAHEIIESEGTFAQYDFFNAAEQYLNAPIDHSLESKDMIIKIFSLLDRRIGKRTLLKRYESIQNDLEIIQYFYRLRCEAEGWEFK